MKYFSEQHFQKVRVCFLFLLQEHLPESLKIQFKRTTTTNAVSRLKAQALKIKFRNHKHTPTHIYMQISACERDQQHKITTKCEYSTAHTLETRVFNYRSGFFFHSHAGKVNNNEMMFREMGVEQVQIWADLCTKGLTWLTLLFLPFSSCVATIARCSTSYRRCPLLLLPHLICYILSAIFWIFMNATEPCLYVCECVEQHSSEGAWSYACILYVCACVGVCVDARTCVPLWHAEECCATYTYTCISMEGD